MLVKGMLHVLDGTELDSERFHSATQNGAQFQTYELFISENVYLIVWDHMMIDCE